MADVDYAYEITQDSTIVPDRYTLDANVHVTILDGTALGSVDLGTDLYLLDTNETDPEVKQLVSGLWLVNVAGTLTEAQIQAALVDAARKGGMVSRGDAGSTAKTEHPDTADLNVAETPTVLVPGSWTPT